MLRKSDDGSTHVYAAVLIRYLELPEFVPDLRLLLHGMQRLAVQWSSTRFMASATRVTVSNHHGAPGRVALASIPQRVHPRWRLRRLTVCSRAGHAPADNLIRPTHRSGETVPDPGEQLRRR